MARVAEGKQPLINPSHHREIRQPIRVLFVVSQLGLGGSEKRFVEFLLRLDQLQVEPRVIVFQEGGEREKTLRQAAIPFRALGRNRRSVTRRLSGIFSECRAFRPDIIQAFDCVAGLYGCVAGRLARVPVILSAFNGNLIPARRVRYAMRWAWPLIDKVICNSEDGRRYLIRKCGHPPERLVVLPNGFDFRRMEKGPDPFPSLRNELHVDSTQPLIGMVSRLNGYKDPLVFARAAAIVHKTHPRVMFCIVGSGPDEFRVQTFVKQEKLSSYFALVPERFDAPWLARDFDICVLCSRSEGLPNVVLEYMFWNKPCVVTDVGDCRDVVQHGQTGLVVPAQNPDALALALVELLNDPESARAMGAAGRARLEAHYRIERYVDELLRLYFASLHEVPLKQR